MATLGYIGEKLDLLVRQGATLGPFAVTLTNPDNTPVNLTGATLRAHLRKKALDTGMVNQNGRYIYTLGHTRAELTRGLMI